MFHSWTTYTKERREIQPLGFQRVSVHINKNRQVMKTDKMKIVFFFWFSQHI